MRGRLVWLGALVVGALLLPALGAVAGQSPSGPEACVVDQVNSRRQAAPLRWSGVIHDRLVDHARNMARRGELGHSGMTARTEALPSGWTAYGEAVHVVRLNGTSEAGVTEWCRGVVDGLWKSAPHRQILAGDYDFIAVGTYWDGDSIWMAAGVFSHPDHRPASPDWPDDYSQGLVGGWVGTFLDDDGSVFEHDIEDLARSGVTNGCNPPLNTRFCPDDPVSRGQMAAFLVRALGLESSNENLFIDDESSQFHDDIETLGAAGVTQGCNPPRNDRFCPDRTVTRAEMATFLGRALGLRPSGDDQFTDIAGSVHRKYINGLAEAGITVGCDPDRRLFCPREKVSRAQMAAFLVRAGLTD